MNRVVLNNLDPNHQKDRNSYTLKDQEVLTHLTDHLMIKIGSTIKVLVIGEGLGSAIVKKLLQNEVTLEVTIDEPGLPQNIRLLVAASRPPTVKKVLEHGASFGVKSFSFFKAQLSEKSYLTSKVFEEASLKDLLTKGLAQGSSFCQLPQVQRFPDLKTLMEQSSLSDQRFLLSLNSNKTFAEENIQATDDLTLAIGPERGWTQQEEEILVANGFIPILIGNSTLRVEIATFSALGQLAMLSLNR